MGTQASRQCEPSGWDPGQESEKRAETWPRLWALGSIQLDGAMPAGPDAGRGRFLATPRLQGRETKSKLDDGTEGKVLATRETQGPLVTQERSLIHDEGAQRLPGGGDPSVLRPKRRRQVGQDKKGTWRFWWKKQQVRGAY